MIFAEPRYQGGPSRHRMTNVESGYNGMSRSEFVRLKFTRLELSGGVACGIGWVLYRNGFETAPPLSFPQPVLAKLRPRPWFGPHRVRSQPKQLDSRGSYPA